MGVPSQKPANYWLAMPAPLCVVGPCEHYHGIVAPVEVAGNGDGSPLVPVLEQYEYCYPREGIEIELQATLPVLECTRYEPKTQTGVVPHQRLIAAWRRKRAALNTYIITEQPTDAETTAWLANYTDEETTP